MSDNSEKLANDIGKLALRTSLSQAVKHSVTAVTGVPVLGDAAGQATNTAYDMIPTEVKAGAGAGGVLAVHMGTHIMSVGTVGSIAYGGAVLTAFLPFVATGAVIGGAWWLFNQFSES